MPYWTYQVTAYKLQVVEYFFLCNYLTTYIEKNAIIYIIIQSFNIIIKYPLRSLVLTFEYNVYIVIYFVLQYIIVKDMHTVDRSESNFRKKYVEIKFMLVTFKNVVGFVLYNNYQLYN